MASFRPSGVSIHEMRATEYAQLQAAALAGRRPQAAVWKSFQAALARVKRDALWGEVIPRSKIPAHFAKKYEVRNLYCVDLADFHRGFYTISGREVVFLDLVDHAQYDRWFPGRGK